MAKEWIIGQDGRNLKFKREALLNYGMNRWGLNKAASVGPTSELIRTCSPESFEEWETLVGDKKSIKNTEVIEEIKNESAKRSNDNLYNLCGLCVLCGEISMLPNESPGNNSSYFRKVFVGSQ